MDMDLRHELDDYETRMFWEEERPMSLGRNRDTSAYTPPYPQDEDDEDIHVPMPSSFAELTAEDLG